MLKVCEDAGKLGMPQAADKADLHSISVTRPSKYAVRFTANPQATEEAENLSDMFSAAMPTTTGQFQA